MSDILSDLAKKYKTDKGIGRHGYTPIYNRHFENIRLNNLTFLEIGLGDIESYYGEGESIRMWRDYFPNSKIYDIDCNDKKFLEDDRITTFQGQQQDRNFLEWVIKTTGNFDIIIDDASHIHEYTIATFECMIEHLKVGGVYIIEDTHTSYLENWTGTKDPNDFEKPTIMNYMFKLTHSLNHREIPGYFLKPILKGIKSITFYPKMIWIQK